MSEKSRLELVVEATENLENVLREARGVMKDLKHLIKEANSATNTLDMALDVLIKAKLDEEIDERVGPKIDEAFSDIGEAQQKMYDKIQEGFVKLTNMMLFGNVQGRGEILPIIDQILLRSKEK